MRLYVLVLWNIWKQFRHRLEQLDIKRTRCYYILHEACHLKAYKIQFTNQNLANLLLGWLKGKNHIFLSNVAHFKLGGYVNEYNCSTWKNARKILEKPQQAKMVRFLNWWGDWSLFSKNQRGDGITVNGTSYQQMTTNFLWNKLDDIDVENINTWFFARNNW